MIQRMMIAVLAGKAASEVESRFQNWRVTPDPRAVEKLYLQLREHAHSPSVVYYVEWIDHWLSGDQIPGPGSVVGLHVQATCLTPDEARAQADDCGDYWEEQKVLASRLREAAIGWGGVALPYAIIVVREPIDTSPTDEEIEEAAQVLPDWL